VTTVFNSLSTVLRGSFPESLCDLSTFCKSPLLFSVFIDTLPWKASPCTQFPLSPPRYAGIGFNDVFSPRHKNIFFGESDLSMVFLAARQNNEILPYSEGPRHVSAFPPATIPIFSELLR